MLATRRSSKEVVGLLDLGSSKISCVIAERPIAPPAATASEAQLRVLGFGQQRADGIRGGMLVDLDRAETGARKAIGVAEEQAGITLDEVVVAVSSSRLQSTHFRAHIDLDAGHVRPRDLTRLTARARQFAERDGRVLMDLHRISSTIDGETGIREPLRMAGRRLSCQFHAVTADPAPLRNLTGLIDRCYLSVRALVPTGLASAIAATTEDERHTGVACIDIGAGAAKIAVLAGGRFLHVDTVAVGGANLTHDIAVMLSAPLTEAERIKTLYGTLTSARSDASALIPYRRSQTGVATPYQIELGDQLETTQSELFQIVYPRTRIQLELLQQRLARSAVVAERAKSIVLTGGASQLLGLSGLANEIFSRPVRIGGPSGIEGMPEPYLSPAASTVLGLGLVEDASVDVLVAGGTSDRASESYLRRMEQWLRESF